MTETEVNIRASWAINCAIQVESAWENNHKAYHMSSESLIKTASQILRLLDEVKAVIRPPMPEIKGRSKAEEKDKLNEVREDAMQ